MKLKASHLSESMRSGKQLAHITLELPLEELPDALEMIDASDLNDVQLARALEASHALRMRLDDEATLVAAASPMPLPPADEDEDSEEA
jgi:hypothetical protein